MADRGKRKMEKKHVSFSKDGMTVGVKTMHEDEYADKTQRYAIPGIHQEILQKISRRKRNMSMISVLGRSMVKQC